MSTHGSAPLTLTQRLALRRREQSAAPSVPVGALEQAARIRALVEVLVREAEAAPANLTPDDLLMVPLRDVPALCLATGHPLGDDLLAVVARSSLARLADAATITLILPPPRRVRRRRVINGDIPPEQIRALLGQRGWTIARLARELDCSVRTVCYWLAGHGNPARATAARLRRLIAETPLQGGSDGQ